MSDRYFIVNSVPQPIRKWVWRNIRPNTSMQKPTVIIVGAGAAGLMAAVELSGQFQITILEALPRTGGRIYSISQDGDIIEAGAEFVHGNLPVTLKLLKNAGIDYVEIAGEMYRKKNDRLIAVEEMTEGWEGLILKMKEVKEDCTMQQLLEEYYSGPENAPLRNHVRSYAAGFDLADIAKASVKALYKEWSAEEEKNYRIPAGYGALIQYLQQQAVAEKVVIHTDAPVKSVQWQQGAVKVHTTNGQEYTADKLLVTVPLSVLQQPFSKAYIDFSPTIQLVESKAGEMGFGAVIKVVLEFKKLFWKKDTGFLLSDELFSTWWTQLPDKKPFLTGWIGGPTAAAISNDTDEEILEKAMASLSAIFNKDIPDLKKDLAQSWVFNWQKNEFAMGGYSYPTLHSKDAKTILTTPIEGTLFFAGEALYSGDHPGTVEAALVSAIRAAKIIKSTVEV
ncbi:MAG: amine oxidase [Ferruginibacter sp.]|nr:amine oxidase [Ferruginibacter sp.]